MNRVFISFLGIVFLSGCAKLTHLDELLRLKSLSDNQTQQRKYVKEQNKKFEALLDAVKNNRIPEYPDKKSFLKAFGEPIFTKKVRRDDKTLEQWLYRNAQKLSGSERVYVYFSETGDFIDFKHIAPENKAINQEKKK